MILYAITNKLYNLFGEDVDIYTDNTVQNMKAPCFFVREINAIGKDYRETRKMITHSYDVIYVSNEDRLNGKNLDLDAVSRRLLSEFEFIEFESDKYRTLNRKTEKTDGDLHCTFDVIEILRDKRDLSLMEKLEMKWKERE